MRRDRGPVPDSGQTLRVLTWAGRWGEALRAEVSEPFTALTGIEVEHVVTVGLPLPTELVRALQSGERPPVDVVWCNGLPAAQADEAGWCAPLPDSITRGIAELPSAAWPVRATSPSVVNAYVVHYVLAYQRSLYPVAAPAGWQCLLDERHRGRVVVYPGGNGLFGIAQVVGGGRLNDVPRHMSPAWSWLSRLVPSLAMPAYSVGLETQLLDRKIDLAFRALPNVRAFQAAGADVGWVVPAEGTADTVDTLWVPRGLPDARVARAQRYLRFALSAPVQERWCARLGVLPMHPAASSSRLLQQAGVATLAEEGRRLTIDYQIQAGHETEWAAKFDRLLSG